MKGTQRSRSSKYVSSVVVALFILSNVQGFGVGVSRAEASGLESLSNIPTYMDAAQAGTSNAGTIYFGSYYQNPADSSHGIHAYDNAEDFDNDPVVQAAWANKEGIQWRVLDKASTTKGTETGILLLSDKALYADAFDASSGEWKGSDVRATLTGETTGAESSVVDYGSLTEGTSFARDAFDKAEYNAIAETDTKMEKASWQGSEVQTYDKLFLLSRTQANKYKTEGLDLKSGVTKFARGVKIYGNDKGVEESVGDTTGNCIWWLGSPGDSSFDASSVSSSGAVTDSSGVNDSGRGVRAALNLNLESVLYLSAAVGGKTSPACGGDFALAEYTGVDGWKLTLKDSSMTAPTFVKVTQSATGETVDDLAKTAGKGGKIDLTRGLSATYGEVKVSYASKGTGEYVSAVVSKSSAAEGKYCNYAKISNTTTQETPVEVGTSQLDDGEYRMYVYSETANGDKETDYASAFATNSETNGNYFTIHKAGTSFTAYSGKLSATYKNSGLTARLGNFNLSFDSDTYDTNVIAESDSALTADASGTMLAGDVAINESTTLTMQNQFTLSGNLYANEGAKLSIADSLTMVQSGVINFNNSGEDASARSATRTFTVSGTGNFIANNSLILLNTDLANSTGDKIDMSTLTGVVYGSARVMVAYDPCFKTGATVTGNSKFLLLPSTTADDILQVTGVTSSYNGVLYTPTVAFDDDAKAWKVTSFTSGGADETAKATSDGVNVQNFVWLETVNNLQKRLGDLRGGEESDMAWARFQRSNDDYDGARPFNVSGNMYQVGYDFSLKNQVASRGYFGVSLERFDGSQSYKLGGGDVASTSLGAYYTKIYDSGHYFDFILRYGRLENDSTSYDSSLLIPVSTKLDYAMNSVTLSGEYGYRANLGKSGLYLEPQAEFIYGYLSGAQATSSTNILADIDSTNHFVTRLGLAFGQRVKNFNYYLRGSYYHDFAGTTHVKYGDASYKQDSAQNWWEISLGGGWNISKLSYFYAELTKHFKDVSNSLNFNVGFRFTL